MNFDELVKSQKLGDKVKSSRCKAREWLAERSRYAFYSFSSCFFVIFVVAMKRNTADGAWPSSARLFTKSSIFILFYFIRLSRQKRGLGVEVQGTEKDKDAEGEGRNDGV